MDPTIELLNEVWSGARTGLTSLRAILDITDDTNLRNEIYRQETEYQNVVREAENLLAGHGERPDGVNCMERACTWTGIRMSTLTDKSTPHMAGPFDPGQHHGRDRTHKSARGLRRRAGQRAGSGRAAPFSRTRKHRALPRPARTGGSPHDGISVWRGRFSS